MAETAVSICSNALLKLGANPINDFSDDSDRARLASNLYSTVRDRILRAKPWNCAVKRVLLSPDVETPPYDFAYYFTLPGDWLRTLQVGELGDEIEYRIEGRKILADTTSMPLRYIYRNDIPATWDSLLQDVMVQAMAAEMAYAITQSTTKEQAEYEKLKQALRLAGAVDGMEDQAETFGDFRLFNSRLSS